MSKYTVDQWLTIADRAEQAGDLQTAERARAQAAALAAVEAARPPSEMMRTVAQGATYATADELEAMARNPGEIGSYLSGRPAPGTEQTVGGIRGRLKAYKEARPGEALLLESAGAVAPSVATLGAGPATGFLGTAGRAALDAGLYAAGDAEGGPGERLTAGAIAAPFGAAAGTAANYAVRGLQSGSSALANRFADWVRQVAGTQGSTLVTTELKRLAEKSGLSADEILQRVAEGEVFAEMNETLRHFARAYKAESPEAGNQILKGLEGRPQQTRMAARDKIQQDLTGVPGNVRANLARTDADLRRAEGVEYGAVWGTNGGGPAPDGVVAELQTVIRADPAVAAEAARTARITSRGAVDPFYTVDDQGNVAFTRWPTLEEAEIVRRSINDAATGAYKAGAGTRGKAYEGLEESLRGALDQSSDPLRAARANAAQLRSGREAVDAGRRAISAPADQVELDLQTMSPDMLPSYRAGYMDALRSRLETRAGASLIRDLADDSTAAGRTFRLLYPDDKADEALDYLRRAANSQRTSSLIVGGSPTAETMAKGEQIGESGYMADAVSTLQGDVMAGMRLAIRTARQMGRTLSPAEMEQIGRMLVTTDRDALEAALTDPAPVRAVQEAIVRLLNPNVATRAGARTGGAGGVEVLGPMFGVGGGGGH